MSVSCMDSVNSALGWDVNECVMYGLCELGLMMQCKWVYPVWIVLTLH